MDPVNIERFLTNKTFAFVGATTNPRKSGNSIYKELKKRGLKLFPVNPKYSEIEGDKCYPGIADIPVKPEAVIIITPKKDTFNVVSQCIDLNIKYVWMQLHADSDDAVQLAKASGINLVYNKCLLMFVKPVTGVHKFHRFFAMLFKSS